MDYLYARVADAQFREITQLRVAFRLHLQRVSAALRAIEWNDSGDGDWAEDQLIREVLRESEDLDIVDAQNPGLPVTYQDADERGREPRFLAFYKDAAEKARERSKTYPVDAVARVRREDDL